MTDVGYWRNTDSVRSWPEECWFDLLWSGSDSLGPKLIAETSKKGMAVLDLWCGDGRLIPSLVRDDGEYTGVDNCMLLDEAMRKYPSSPGARRTFHKRDLLDWLGFLWDQEFDCIVAAYCLHFISEYDQFPRLLEDIKARVKPWGSFVYVWYDQHQSLMTRLENEFGTREFDQEETDIDSIFQSIYIKWIKAIS